MKHYDFLITPSTGSVAPRIGKLEKTDSCLIWTFFGAPAISLPIFFDCKDRLPFGLQIIAKRYDDFLKYYPKFDIINSEQALDFIEFDQNFYSD